MVSIKFDNRDLPKISLNIDRLMLVVSILLANSFEGLLIECLVHLLIAKYFVILIHVSHLAGC